jgi:predicted RNA-binding protein YlxR (DUF448 family)
LVDGALVIGGGLGRGAWLCAGRQDCFETAARRGAIERALRAAVGPDAIEALGRRLSDR